MDSCCVLNVHPVSQIFSIRRITECRAGEWIRKIFRECWSVTVFDRPTSNFCFYSHLSSQAPWPSSPWCCTAPAHHLPAFLKSLSPATTAAKLWIWKWNASVRLASLGLFPPGSGSSQSLDEYQQRWLIGVKIMKCNRVCSAAPVCFVTLYQTCWAFPCILWQRAASTAVSAFNEELMRWNKFSLGRLH